MGKAHGTWLLCLAAAAGLFTAPDDARAACAPEPADLISWYRAEGNAGDSRGANHGSNLGTFAAGRVGQAFSFNGSSGYVSVPHHATLQPASITIEAWVNFSALPGIAMIASKPFGGGTGNSYQIYFQSNQIVAEISDASGRPKAIAPWTPTIGTWYHVAMTFDDASRALTAYIDGAQVASVVASGSYIQGTNPLLIGVEDDGAGLAFYFAGLIDEMTLYGRALTGPEIQSIANAGAAGKCAPQISLSSTGVDFGSQGVGTTSAAQTVTLSNVGTATATIAGIATSGDFAAGGCPNPGTLAAAASCTLSVTFTPTATGIRVGSVTITDDAPGSPRMIALTGTGVAPTAILSRTSVAFGAQTIGTLSAPQTVTLSNSGTAPLDISGIVVSGDFAATGCPNPGSLPAGMSCTFSITFTPTAIGTRTGSITVTDNASGSPRVIALSGDGSALPLPTAVLSSTSVAFASREIGTTSAAQTVTLTNTGTAPLAIATISVSGDFAFTGCVAASSLAPGQSCAFSITFTPSAAGIRSGSITITDNASGSPRTIALSGTGTLPAPIVSLSATSVAFPSQAVGTTSSSPQTVTLTNAGTAALDITGIVLSGDFAYGGCAFPASLAPGASCTFTITFTPLVEGVRLGSIAISSNASGSPHVIALSGTGAGREAGILRVSALVLDFGEQQVGGTSAAQTLRLSNDGNAPLALFIALAPGPFAIAPACPSSLAPGSNCMILVEFAPPSSGTHRGSLTISDGTGSITVILQGLGVAIGQPSLGVVPSIDFGAVVVGESASRALTLGNSGDGVLVISSATASGAGFSLAGSCTQLAPRESCGLEAVFTPETIGRETGRIDIASNDPRGRVSVELLGEGVERPVPQLVISPGSIGFGNQVVGTTSEPQAIEIANVGNGVLHLTGLTATAGFGVTSQCPAVLEPGMRCSAFVRFTPGGIGRHAGALTAQSNDSRSRQSLSLTGSGCMPYSVRSRIVRLNCGN